jgi:RNA-directed DNA polymerase
LKHYPTRKCADFYAVTLYKKLLELFKEEKQMNDLITSCASTDQLWNTWESIDWNRCEIMVKKLQARIVKAQKKADMVR